MKRNKICLAIPTYNRDELLIRTIRQVKHLTLKPDELIIVDQTRNHDMKTNRYLKNLDKKKWVHWLRQDIPNLPKARNRVLRETKCDIIVFIDDDVILPKEFIKCHLMNYRDTNIDSVAGGVIQELNYPPTPKKWEKILDYKYFRLDGFRRIYGISTFRGCNHSVKRNYIMKIGGYDENYIGWALREDSDMAIRIWKKGGVIVFDPKAYLEHLSIPTGGCNFDKRNIMEWEKAFPDIYFSIKHLMEYKKIFLNSNLENMWRIIICRNNVYKPWLLIWSFLSYIYAFYMAWITYNNMKIKQTNCKNNR